MRTWTAYVAPLGVLSEDGRRLSPDVEWTLYREEPQLTGALGEDGRPTIRLVPRGTPVALLRVDPREVLGTVEELTTEDGRLIARGTLLDDVSPIDLVSLVPQLELWSPPSLGEQVEYDEVAQTFTFVSGEIRAVALGCSPIWPDLWFRLDQVPAEA